MKIRGSYSEDICTFTESFYELCTIVYYYVLLCIIISRVLYKYIDIDTITSCTYRTF